MFVGALPIHLFRHFCHRMYDSATMHSITDRQTDDSIMPIANHTALHYDQVKSNWYLLSSNWFTVIYWS